MAAAKTKRALALCGASAALLSASVLGAAPALADTMVVAWAHGNVHADGPAVSERVVSYVNPGYSYTAQCWLEGDLVTDLGITNRNWVRLKLNSGGIGYVSAIYLKGNDKGNVPNHC
ncbi:SH3 domain-containing protein [Streptomyces beihaiensis]|uniref:SH3 domain-containing protein n=1 Tax=Streptomyces beihaiensis TaxID=2984495 RepID=A0ABT3TVZ9_9ACTN|nr:SH3 domain-containing protein [Streptomyces beihaiensis]MCX3061206.1 SH3 domain-containing protein [Streptomyces beihaiensis]